MGLTASIGIERAEAAQEREDARCADLLEELMLAHQKRVFRIALRMLGDVDEAANAAQDCFLHAYRAIARCPAGAARQRRWLVRIVSNLCLDRLRNRKWRWWKQRLGLEGAAVQGRPGALGEPDRELLSREMSDCLGAALGFGLRSLTPVHP